MRRLLLLAIVSGVACHQSTAPAPAVMVAPSSLGAGVTANELEKEVARQRASLGGMRVGFDSGIAIKLLPFPPRNDAVDFRRQLEAVYQTQLNRSPIQTFVDIEGTVVWTQEYLRYRLSGCGHAQTAQIVSSEIDGAAAPPDCGRNVPFPPRDEPFDFRVNTLEPTYRDVLHRSPVLTFVDMVGDIVWTTEYLRYRVGACSHEQAVQLVLDQVLSSSPITACPVTIGFNGLSSNGSAVASYSEAGFSLTMRSGAWSVSTGTGRPSPAIQLVTPDTGGFGEIRISDGGSLFTFQSMDLYSTGTPISYTISGFKSSSRIYAIPGSISAPGSFVTVRNPAFASVVDGIGITISNPIVPCCSAPTVLDNLVLRRN